MAILTPRWPVPILTLAVLSPTALPAAPPNPFAHLFTYALPTTAPKPPPGLNFKIIPPSDVTPASKDAEIVGNLEERLDCGAAAKHVGGSPIERRWLDARAERCSPIGPGQRA